MSFQHLDGSMGGHIKAWINGVQLEEAARKQLDNVASLPFIFKHLAVLPDVHWGMGATVGSCIPTKGALIPAAVGVDIGCGMSAIKTSLTASDLPDNLHTLRTEIEKRVPHGRTNNGGEGDRGAWHNVPAEIFNILKTDIDGVNSANKLEEILKKHSELGKHWSIERAAKHIGTLGTGNHFIEICLDENQNVWVMLHSGSRGIGNRIGTYFIEKAQKECAKWFIPLPDKDLAYLPEGTPLFDDYVEAVSWAQNFAKINRKFIMDNALAALGAIITKPFSCDCGAVSCHHNYVSKENHFGENVWITRKGAVSARKDQLGIIPGSMGVKSYIVRGKGNPESFCTCSHGAGRSMSRNEAKKTFSLEDHARATDGVECRKDVSVIDETPGAYKPIDAVMAAQKDLVEIVHTLKQVVCVKG